MSIMPFVILIVMFMLGISGKSRGVVNYKFALERIVFTLAIMPGISEFIKSKLTGIVPDMLASIIGVIFGLIIVFGIITFIYGKIAHIPEYEYTSSDRTLGFITGAIRGFAVICLLIMFYGISFLDTVLPGAVTMNMKENFANNRIENAVEYYRSSVYKVYKKASSSGVTDLYQGKSELLKEDNTYIAGYIKWSSRDYTAAPEIPAEAEKAPEAEKK